MKNHEVANQSMVVSQKLLTEVNNSIVIIRDVPVIADADVAALYDVETKRVNEAVRNNPNKFPNDYMFELSLEENKYLRSKISSTKVSSKSRTTTKVFTEKGLYMLATILRSKKSIEVTFAIIETFVKVREMKRELVDLHNETDKNILSEKMNHFSDVLSDIVMPDLETSETESILELNFIIGKIKHTVKRIRKNSNGE